MHVDAMRPGRFRRQFVEGDLALVGDARLDPASHARQLAVPAAVALRPRRQQSGFAPQPDQIVHELRRHPEVPRRLAVPVTLIDERNHAHAQLYRMWLFPNATPISAWKAGNHITANLEILNRTGCDTL
ncbi:MAG: hypothetical protein ABGW82_04370 [Paracoccus sp. (in: a-proteobacteria)]